MTSHPPPPSRIGKVTTRKYINGRPMVYTVLDEIVHIHPSNPGKAIYLQMLRFHDDDWQEMRLRYYMIAHKPRTKGKWTFGQFAPMVRREDFEEIMMMARAKGWIS